MKKIEELLKKQQTMEASKAKKSGIKIVKKKTKSQIKDDEERERNCFKFSITKLINHPVYITFMTFVTIYALFFDDFRLIALNK